MATMTNEYSLLPNTVLQSHTFRDVDDNVGTLIEEIKTLQAAGKYAAAAEKINTYSDPSGNTLGDYIINAEWANAIDEETRNLEIFCMKSKQNVYYTNIEPSTAVGNDVWIGGGSIS